MTLSFVLLNRRLILLRPRTFSPLPPPPTPRSRQRSHPPPPLPPNAHAYRPMASRKHGKAMEQTLEHWVEHYKDMEASLDILTPTQRFYQPSTENLQSWIKDLWEQ
ncbi:hypothetical protein N7G274_000313 [Stereocaulon virgatum]|uniref:Uncharacterized protein n=1 Tax=Stereocaulon virgatum TaxID=373712 RepID=A0ABR4ARS2_9LECA